MSSLKYEKNRQKIITFFVGVVIVIVALIVVFFVVIGVSKVDGDSMLPTLNNNQTLVFYRLEKSYDRGEIVAVDMPNGKYYVKRIIGIEGDEIDIRDGKVYLNGTALEETYIQGTTTPQSNIIEYPVKVTTGKYFVLGDNREHSTDSRAIGLVSRYAILGRILVD